jgi:hypothetical protein
MRGTVIVGEYVFDRFNWDSAVDILYLGRRGVADGDTPEGHVWLYPDDESDEVIGLIIFGAALLQENGVLELTGPLGQRVAIRAVDELLVDEVRGVAGPDARRRSSSSPDSRNRG